MKSIQQMIDQCEGLIGTKDVSEWESEFLESVSEQQRFRKPLSAKQVEIVERIYQKHFA